MLALEILVLLAVATNTIIQIRWFIEWKSTVSGMEK
jgi:hypothetical protein